MNGQTQTNRRWYDGETETSQFVTSIQIFPDRIQTILCQGIMDTAEREFRIREMLESVRSLGPEKVTILLKSQGKHRFTDKNGQLHRAITTFTIMPHESRLVIVRKSNELIQTTLDYLGICRYHQHSPTLPEIARVSTTFLEEGREAAHQYLNAVRDLFSVQTDKRTMRVTSEGYQTTEDLGIVIDDNEMRIRPDRF